MRRSLRLSTAALVSSLGLGCTEGPAPTDPGSLLVAEPAAAALVEARGPHQPKLLVTGLREPLGSTVGPGGALFVTAPLTGRIWRATLPQPGWPF